MRTCDQCGGRMQPFTARVAVGSKRVCPGCAGIKNLAALENPIAGRTGKHPEEWYHGSPHDFPDFDDPMRFHDQDEEEETGRFRHWNVLLGNHFTSDHRVAADFSQGLHTSSGNESEEEPVGHVAHVRLHLKNPKVYASEHDMDQEVYEYEHGENRNFHDNYAQPHHDEDDDEDDEDDFWDEPDYAARNRRQFQGDSKTTYSKRDPDESVAYGFHPKATGWLNTHPDKEGIARRYKERMQRAGYDGVVYGNEYEDSQYGKQAASAIAFDHKDIEVTQHHYGHQECLKGEQARNSAPPRGQEMVPGTEDLPRTIKDRDRPDTSQPWPKTFTPHYFEHGRGWDENAIGWGHEQPMLTNPRGRTMDLPRRTAKWTMKYTRYGKNGYEDVEQEISGPLYHGGGKRWREGTDLKPGRKTNPWGDDAGKSTHVYFTDRLDVAADYARQSGGHVFEVDPQGEIKPDHHEGEYKTKHPVRVVRRLDPAEWDGSKTAAIGEESAREHAGAQDVYAVRDGNSMTMLCRYHADTHVGNRRAADDLGAQVGLSGRERSAEILGEARKGSCAACGKGTSEQLKMMSPLWVRNADQMTSRGDRPRPARRRDKPLRTKPLPRLKQSENIRWASKGDLFHADAGKVRFEEGGYHGDHKIPAGAELHHDENEAWNAAIEHWKNFKSDFPRVYVAHQPKAETKDGKTVLSHPAEASELDYDHEKHPAIRGHNETSDEPIMYHGSSRDEDDDVPEEITPSGGSQSFGPGVADPSYAYATPSLKDAWSYAHKRVENGRGGRPTVYRVTPHEPEDVEEDPSWTGDSQTGHSRGTMTHDKRSKKGFEVLDEVPMSQHQEHEWSQSPYNDEASDDDWDEDDDHHYASLKTLADWDDGDEQPEWCEDCNEEHTEDEGHRECRACGERHEDYEQKMEHEGSWTDWDRVYPGLNKTVHRALEPLSLPDHVHDAVHDESKPMHERASALLGHLDREHGDNIGMHWSDQRGEAYGADKFAGHGAPEGKTQVMLHAKLPERNHIETDPDELNDNQVISYGDHDEAEVPVSYGSPVHITGVSWRPGGHNQEWRTHNLKEPIKMTAKLPTLRTLAHDATENQAIRHCPFCGGGKIIGRADGSVECEFCHNFFTVQIQPQYPNFPQTINGMPQQIPGMPGQVETPGGPGMGADGFPPDGGDPGMGGGPPWAQEGEEAPTDGPSDETEEGSEDASGEGEPPPFAKQSALPVFRTVTGALLTEDDYARHLAIRTAPDRGAMIARIRAERQGA